MVKYIFNFNEAGGERINTFAVDKPIITYSTLILIIHLLLTAVL